ncbi:hypothetical protein RHO14_06370 [Orbus wheelerorum]|uniref:hypothetical protein n=1 Tax=Orbus wheelerorum TaxID=3074111 RepID=UPI00370DB7FB
MEIIAYPIQVKGNSDASYNKKDMTERAKRAKSGTFLLGSNGWWHGGMHFKSITDTGKDNRAAITETFDYDDSIKVLKLSDDPTCISNQTSFNLLPDTTNLFNIATNNSKQCKILSKPKITEFPQEAETFNEAVQSIAKGKIIAYRLNKEWLQQEVVQSFKNNVKKTSFERYSTSFVLIEHNLEYEYIRPVNKALGNIIFNGCKFYSLYMHLAPITDLQSAKIDLPWFLTTKRKPLTTPLKRSQDITLINPASGKPTDNINLATANHLVAILHSNLGTIYIPKTNVAKLKAANQYVMASPLDYYYQPFSNNVDMLDPSIEYDKIVIPAMPIEVDAGELIGYQGGTIIDKKQVGGLFHFEIFAENTDFMNNISVENGIGAYYKNNARYFYLLLNDLGYDKSFAAGKFYLDSGASSTNWHHYYHIDAAYDNNRRTIDYNILNTENSMILSDGSVHNYTTIDPRYRVPYANPLKICSDADWLEGPTAWQLKPITEYLTDAGQVDSNKSLPASTECMVFKAKSEWSSKELDIKYSAIENKITNYLQFIDTVKQHCFWQEVQAQIPSFPQSDEVWHFHPVSFIEQLRKIHTPYWDAPNPFKLYQYMDKHSSEALLKLRLRQQELNTWLGSAKVSDITPQGTATDALKMAFKTWFGFEQVAPTPNSKTNNQATIPTPPVEVYNNNSNQLLSLPIINTLPHAIIWIRDIIQRQIALIETIGISNYVKAYNFFNGCLAYVYADDSRHHIHFGYQYLAGKSTAEMLQTQGQSNLMNIETIAHELAHFYDVGEMTDSNGTLLKKGLYDLRLKYIDAQKTTFEIFPYGEDNCKDIAKKSPIAALCNADNFCYFINYDKKQGSNYANDNYDYF